MTESIITYRSMTKFYAGIILGIVGSLFGGYFLADFALSVVTLDFFIIIVVFACIPVMITAIGFLVGWFGKKNAIDYREPTWDFEPVQLSIEDARNLEKQNKRMYWRMVANSNYWIFFIPIALILFMAALPVYLYIESPSIAPLDAWMFAVSLSLSYSVASIGALRATSNSASEDFNILLVREALKLAKLQENTPGLSQVRIVLDRAEQDGYSVYEAPRVVSRVIGLEREGYIESWSEDLGAVNRVLCRIYESEGHPEVIWWWFSEDRHYRKFVDKDRNGYYVRYPILYKTGTPGVKDVGKVIENGIAIMILEWFHTRGETEELSLILEKLNVQKVQST
ncbi:MAG: hypothetical protein ACFFEE_06910 [Candidatus Thorarchaeota archaeon]